MSVDLDAADGRLQLIPSKYANDMIAYKPTDADEYYLFRTSKAKTMHNGTQAKSFRCRGCEISKGNGFVSTTLFKNGLMVRPPSDHREGCQPYTKIGVDALRLRREMARRCREGGDPRDVYEKVMQEAEAESVANGEDPQSLRDGIGTFESLRHFLYRYVRGLVYVFAFTGRLILTFLQSLVANLIFQEHHQNSRRRLRAAIDTGKTSPRCTKRLQEEESSRSRPSSSPILWHRRFSAPRRSKRSNCSCIVAAIGYDWRTRQEIKPFSVRLRLPLYQPHSDFRFFRATATAQTISPPRLAAYSVGNYNSASQVIPASLHSSPSASAPRTIRVGIRRAAPAAVPSTPSGT